MTFLSFEINLFVEVLATGAIHQKTNSVFPTGSWQYNFISEEDNLRITVQLGQISGLKVSIV